MTAVTKNTLFSEPHKSILAIVDNRSYISDPRRAGTSNARKFVYDEDPFPNNLDFSLYPYIVVEYPEIEYSKQSAKYSSKEVQWTQSIIVRAAKEGSGANRSDAGKQDMYSIIDSLLSTFNSATIRSSLNSDSLSLQDCVLRQPPTPILIDNQTVFEAQLELTFRVRIKVQ